MVTLRGSKADSSNDVLRASEWDTHWQHTREHKAEGLGIETPKPASSLPA